MNAFRTFFSQVLLRSAYNRYLLGLLSLLRWARFETFLTRYFWISYLSASFFLGRCFQIFYLTVRSLLSKCAFKTFNSTLSFLSLRQILSSKMWICNNDVQMAQWQMANVRWLLFEDVQSLFSHSIVISSKVCRWCANGTIANSECLMAAA